MKKKLCLVFIIGLVILSGPACSKKTNPVASTVNSTSTQVLVSASNTVTPDISCTFTPFNTPQFTKTVLPSATRTYTYTPTLTITVTFTETVFQTPSITQTVTIFVTLPYTEIISVQGGTFTQTDANNTAESFVHTISGFKMGIYPVTYDLWYSVRQWAIVSGYAFAHPGREGNRGTNGALPTASRYQPVTMINWGDAIVWCNAYSELSGLQPCYTKSGVVLRDSGASNVEFPVCAWSGNGYRLPTEGEWQYAAAYIDGVSWTPYDYASGATADYTNAAATGLVAWYSANSGNVTHDVGGKNSNALGIFDMSGNVDEWCWDGYDLYPVSPVTDYRGPTGISNRILRGGFYSSSLTDSLRIGTRGDNTGDASASNYGMRIVKLY